MQMALQRQPVCKGGGDLKLSCKFYMCSSGVEVEGSYSEQEIIGLIPGRNIF